MPYKLSTPLEREFVLEETDKALGVDASDPTKITIRQAAQGEHERRNYLFDDFKQSFTADGITATRLFPKWDEVKRMEVKLTLVDCNIQDETGKPLFKFITEGKRKKVDPVTFDASWSKLPPILADDIHRCVLAVNVLWNSTTPEGEDGLGEEVGEK